MSVLVKDMKMPESCSRCLLMVGTFCDVLEADVDPFYDGANKRHASCPLVELPEKHGRLIDADAMCNDLATVDPQYKTMIDWCIRVTEAQPTIIEAEGDEECGSG